MSVRPSTKGFFDFSEIWHVGRGRWYAVWSDPRSRSRAFESWKSFHFRKLFLPPFTLGAGKWPRILKLRHNIWICLGRNLDIFLVFVSCDWNWQKRQLRRLDRQYLILFSLTIFFLTRLLPDLLVYTLQNKSYRTLSVP